MAVTSFSALGHVHTLFSRECDKVSDISALGNVHTLDLSRCDNISDVSALGHVHTLNLSRCRNVVGCRYKIMIAVVIIIMNKLEQENS
jgi:hypothetical protein